MGLKRDLADPFTITLDVCEKVQAQNSTSIFQVPGAFTKCELKRNNSTWIEVLITIDTPSINETLTTHPTGFSWKKDLVLRGFLMKDRTYNIAGNFTSPMENVKEVGYWEETPMTVRIHPVEYRETANGGTNAGTPDSTTGITVTTDAR